MTRTLKVVATIIVWSLSAVVANAQTATTTPTTPVVSEKAAKKIADLYDQQAILKATLPVVQLKGAIKEAEATSEANVDRILHAPKEERKDREAARHPDDGCSWWKGCPVYNTGYSGGYYGSGTGNYLGTSYSTYGNYGGYGNGYNPSSSTSQRTSGQAIPRTSPPKTTTASTQSAPMYDYTGHRIQ